jgi:hypothetical protein
MWVVETSDSVRRRFVIFSSPVWRAYMGPWPEKRMAKGVARDLRGLHGMVRVRPATQVEVEGYEQMVGRAVDGSSR